MHVISYPPIRAAGNKHARARGWLEDWWDVASAADWENLHDVRRNYPTADQVGSCLVFNVSGNKFRLVVGIKYTTETRNGTLYIKHFLTHGEYDKGTWKKDCAR